jgi:uncharacterized membrane protein YdjX (TVP38/TMEM64 family)
LLNNAVSALLVMRLVPAVPFFVGNLVPALVGVRFHTFVWTTMVGILPGAFVFTSLGVGLGGVFDQGKTPDLSLLWSAHVIVPILGLAALAGLPMIRNAIVRGKRD